MKKFALLTALLLLFAFLAGCAQPEEEEPTATPTPTITPTPTPTPEEELSEQEQGQELNEFDSTLIDENSEVEIGEII